MSEFNDEKLKTFLKENMPEAPTPRVGELNVLLQNLGLKTPKPRRRPRVWMAFGGALAAGIMALWLLPQKPTPMNAVVTDAVIEEAAFDISDVTEEDLPSLYVGDEYLSLIAGL